MVNSLHPIINTLLRMIDSALRSSKSSVINRIVTVVLFNACYSIVCKGDVPYEGSPRNEIDIVVLLKLYFIPVSQTC